MYPVVVTVPARISRPRLQRLLPSLEASRDSAANLGGLASPIVVSVTPKSRHLLTDCRHPTEGPALQGQTKGLAPQRPRRTNHLHRLPLLSSMAPMMVL